jgi:Tol biopolymer transport system component
LDLNSTIAVARLVTLSLVCLSVFSVAYAERTPVLRQIKTPHDYYFREMYLPQVSSGPQSPAWSPDGQQLVYAMQGSLWRQSLDSKTAVQLTAGPGYDHQPDWSPDGQHIIFTRYLNDAMELQVLDTDSGKITTITNSGAVNLEPRWSPDGTKIAYVSTSGTGRFHIFTGHIENGELRGSPLVSERKSAVDRYYYSPFDHEISPAWTPDGEALLYVSNPEVPYGSGWIWHHPLDNTVAPSLVRKEETTWRARPDIAPDGRRVIYSSYLGRQWHQLWITSRAGKGEPFPLTYGDYDVASARWSPNGDRVAFTVNETGNTSLRIIRLPGGKISDIEISERRYLQPTGSVRISITGPAGKPSPARISVVTADGRSYGPHDRWLHADDSFDRAQHSGEARYFHISGSADVELPPGPATVTVWRGMESHVEKREIAVTAGKQIGLDIALRPLAMPDEWQGWQSADVHVHMNYGGIYRNDPGNLVQQGEAEDLDVIFNLIVNKEQRVPDHAYFSGNADDASNAAVVLQHSQEFHTGYWGHLGVLGLSEHLLLPDYSAYPETAAESLYPDNATVADFAHEQGALVGYVHPFAYPLPDPANDAALTNALPIDAALGKVDFYEVVGFAGHRASADVWYRLLNTGLRISAAGGTDAMANFASLRGPVGMNRTFVHTDSWPSDPDERREIWMQGLKSGKSIATNGPLLGFSVDGQGPGSVIDLDEASELHYRSFMRSSVAIDRVEVVLNGEVIDTVALTDGAMSADIKNSVVIEESGWLLLRASSEEPHPDIFDMYPYATTSPVYITVEGKPQKSQKDAEYFLAWIERVRESAASHTGYNSDSEREIVLQNIDDAAAFYRD